jgi:hypothetical protein
VLSMTWGLRRVGPVRVICVLAAVLAAVSPAQCGFAGHAGTSADNRHTSNVGGWSKAGTIAIVSGGPNAANLQNPSAMLGGRKVSIRGDANGDDQLIPVSAAPTKIRGFSSAM